MVKMVDALEGMLAVDVEDVWEIHGQLGAQPKKSSRPGDAVGAGVPRKACPATPTHNAAAGRDSGTPPRRRLALSLWTCGVRSPHTPCSWTTTTANMAAQRENNEPFILITREEDFARPSSASNTSKDPLSGPWAERGMLYLSNTVI